MPGEHRHERRVGDAFRAVDGPEVVLDKPAREEHARKRVRVGPCQADELRREHVVGEEYSISLQLSRRSVAQTAEARVQILQMRQVEQRNRRAQRQAFLQPWWGQLRAPGQLGIHVFDDSLSANQHYPGDFRRIHV